MGGVSEKGRSSGTRGTRFRIPGYMGIAQGLPEISSQGSVGVSLRNSHVYFLRNWLAPFVSETPVSILRNWLVPF